MYYEKLLEKIQNRTAVLGVLGLGYVGLPLAVEKANAGFIWMGISARVLEQNTYLKSIGMGQ